MLMVTHVITNDW